MTKYLLNKFLFTVDRDPELVERYREDPTGLVAEWEATYANRILNCHAGEASTWLRFDEEERGEGSLVTYTLESVGFFPLWAACRFSTRVQPVQREKARAGEAALESLRLAAVSAFFSQNRQQKLPQTGPVGGAIYNT